MRRKAIKDLAQFSDERVFAELAAGMNLCIGNANRIETDAQFLAENNRERGAKILGLFADEEAAKVLILLDAIRCPRDDSGFAKQLAKFNSHVAKGIYARCCSNGCVTFGELRNSIEVELHEFYLDGPNDVDWIWYNQILGRREDTIYVDYIEDDGERKWHDPQFGEGWSKMLYVPSRAVGLANAMLSTGWLTAPALAEIARVWRSVRVADDFPWTELRKLNIRTMEAIDAKGLLIEAPLDDHSRIVNEWSFPLWSLDLCAITKVDQTKLREIQAAQVWA